MKKYFIVFEIVRTKISGNCVIGFKEIEDSSDIQEMCEKIKYSMKIFEPILIIGITILK